MAMPTGKSRGEIEAVVESTVDPLGPEGPPLLVAFQNERPSDVPEDPPVNVMDRDSFREWVRPILEVYRRDERELLERAFALDGATGWRAGGNRNRLLLIGAAKRFVSGDDDQPSRFVQFGHPAGEILATSRPSPSEYSPVRSQAERDEAVAFVPRDGTAIHDEFLSRGVAELIATRGVDALALEEVSRRLLVALTDPARGVRATMAGLAGDLGIRTPLLLLSEVLPPDTKVDAETLLSGLGIAAARRLTLTDRPYYRSSHVGFDNRDALPPFPSLGRNSDGVFGAALSVIFGPGSILHLPYAVEHHQKPWGALDRTALENAGYRLNDLLILALLSAPRTESWDATASHLVALGSGPLSIAIEQLMHLVVAQTRAMIDSLDRRIANGSLSDEATYARDHFTRRLESGSLLAEDLTWEVVRSHIGEYGRLMELWPGVHAAAVSHNASTDWFFG